MTDLANLARETARLRRPVLLPARLSALFALRRQRAALAKLDDVRLADLGLSRHDAMAEAGRPFWDVPESWRE